MAASIAATRTKQASRVYVALGNTVEVVDATTRQVINHYQVPGDQILSMAVSPDDTRLYLARESLPSEANSELTVVDPSNGAVIVDSIPLPAGGGYTINAVSQGGIWMTSGYGMDSSLGFLPASNLAAPAGGGASTTAGGGFPATATAEPNVVWIGGTSTIACADPLTGAARASAQVPTPNNDAANISSLTPAGGRVFASYVNDNPGATYLISLTPPARCTG